jgi:hypothetical protein
MQERTYLENLPTKWHEEASSRGVLMDIGFFSYPKDLKSD